MALLQRGSIFNRILYRPIPRAARPAVIQLASFAFRKMHAIQHAALPLEADLCSEKIICEAHGFICFTVPKAGSSSLIRLLSPFGARVISCSVDALYARNAEYQALSQFAFVRNPWARALSAYRDKVVNVSNLGKLRILTRYAGIQPGMPFRDFVNWLQSEEGSDDHADRHWISQHRLLPDSGACSVSRLERMDDDLPGILLKFGIQVPDIPHERRSMWPVDGYRDFYDADMRRAVHRRYERDIELYGFDF